METEISRVPESLNSNTQESFAPKSAEEKNDKVDWPYYENVIDEVLGLNPDMTNPSEFLKSFEGLDFSVSGTGKNDEFYVRGKYRGHDIDISRSVLYPQPGPTGIRFGVDRTYNVSIDGKKIDDDKVAERVAISFRDLVMAYYDATKHTRELN